LDVILLPARFQATDTAGDRFTDIEGELKIELPRLSKPSTQEQLSME
jgi:hypothetical protein